jgi:hypothetical protein
MILRTRQIHRIDLQHLPQVGGDLTQHLVGLDNLDPITSLVQTQGLPQICDDAHVSTGAERSAQIDRDPVHLLVVQSPEHPLSRRHGRASVRVVAHNESPVVIRIYNAEI